MTAAIHFNGVDYANVEAMPPDVRQAYGKELMRLGREMMAKGDKEIDEADDDVDEEEDDAAESDSQTQPRAWGGSQPGGGVPVPAGFEGVSGLGPATDVYLPKGTHLLHLGAPHIDTLVVYHDGFAFRAGNKPVNAWRYDEVEVVTSDFSFTDDKYPQEIYKYSLTRTNGESLFLDNWVKKVDDAVEYHIKKHLLERLTPALIKRYHAGEGMTFGAVRVQKQDGIQLDGKPFAWESIQNIQMYRGRLRVILRDGKHHDVRTSMIPNIEVLGRLIGVTFSSADLIYF